EDRHRRLANRTGSLGSIGGAYQEAAAAEENQTNSDPNPDAYSGGSAAALKRSVPGLARAEPVRLRQIWINANKRRAGNPTCDTLKYSKVNIQVPKLKDDDPKSDSDDDLKPKTDKNEVPRWATSTVWEAANPKLELESRCHVDPEKTEMPELDKFRKFVHRYKPKERTYRNTLSVPSTSAPVVSESEPVVSESAPAVPKLESVVSESGPVVSGVIGDSAHIVTLISGEYSNPAHNQPPTPASATSESHTLAHPSAPHPPNPNLGVQPADAYGIQQPLYPGEPVLIHTADGRVSGEFSAGLER
ncbi:hypothetical protein FRC11_005830, partial [Ceratobasidium sp. 423]